MFDPTRFLADLETLGAFRLVERENPEELRRASAWIRSFFDAATKLIDFDRLGLVATVRTAVDG